MSWGRKYPVFATSLLVLGLLVLAEAGGLTERCVTARTARKRLEQASRELRSLAAIQPAATPENAALIESDLVRTTRVLAAMQAGLATEGPRAARLRDTPAPEHRPDAFFDIAAFVEAMRARAQQAGVALKPDERFGFSTYANEAPESARLAAVFRERQIVQYLLEALLDAQPHQLLSVQRERLAGPARNAAPNPAGAQPGRAPGAGETDYFEIDPRVSARVPGVVETAAFRLSFTGHTAALRTLLNKLAEFELPVVVRAVEVAPADRLADGSAPARPDPAPLVAPPWSRFTVTVEFIALAPFPAAAS